MTASVYCPNCKEYVQSRTETRLETYQVKGDEISINAKVRICEMCKEDIFDEAFDEKTLSLAYEEYRRRKGLLTSKEIRDLRESYGLSQRGLATLLNWGEVTIHRYENGSIQDEAHNSVLLALRDNPQFALSLLSKNETNLNQTEVEKIRKWSASFRSSSPTS